MATATCASFFVSIINIIINNFTSARQQRAKGLLRSTGGAVSGNSNIDTLSARRLLLDCRHADLLVGRGKTTAAVVSDLADQSEREIATNLGETTGLVDAIFANLAGQTSYPDAGNSSHST